MEVQKVFSSRGKHLFRIQGFLFETEKSKNGKIYCRCVKRRREQCLARATLSQEPDLTLLRLIRDHSHEADDTQFVKLTAIGKMKDAVLSKPDKGIKETYDELITPTVTELQEIFVDEEVGAGVPSCDAAKTILHRHRAKLRPKLPQKLTEIVLDDEWRKTADGKDFLLFDDGGNDRILGFSTAELLGAMCDSETILMDGTFHVVPTLFTQLYSLHGLFMGQMIPFVYFLLPDKRRETYVRMLSLVKNYTTSINLLFRPARFHIDFEVGVMKAIREVFPSAEIKGCRFHFGQCISRKAQKVGLGAFNDDPEVKLLRRSCIALSMIPLERIDDAWLQISAQSPAMDHPAYEAAEAFKDYIVRTWLESDTFPRFMWNHYRNFGIRTTNHLEGWHHAFNSVVGKKHVNIFALIRHINDQEKKFRTVMLLLRMGHAPPRKDAKYRKLNEKFMEFVERLESSNIDLNKYLRLVAFNF